MKTAPLIALVLLLSAIAGCTRQRLEGLTKEAEQAMEHADFEHALQCWDRVLKLDPKNVPAYLSCGAIHALRKEWDLALTNLSKAIQIDTAPGYAYCQRGQVYNQKGNFQQAETDLKEGLRLDPGNPYVLNSVAWFRATCPAAGFRDSKAAIEMGNKACEYSDWNESSILDTLAAAYAEAGDFERAIEYQRRALRLMEPTNSLSPQLRDHLALYEKHQPVREPF